MFSGFRSLSANFTLVPNQFFDEVLGHYPSRVITVVGILIRATLGWEDPDTGERRIEAELPLSAFLRPDLCENSARKGLAEAIEAGLIIRTTSASSREGARYAVRWEDVEAQERALEKTRRMNGNQRPIVQPLPKSRGSKNAPLPTNVRGAFSRGPKNAPPYEEKKKKSRNLKKEIDKEKTLNVRKEFDHFVVSEPNSAVGKTVPSLLGEEEERAMDRLGHQVEVLVTELHDQGSERRHRQLLAICEQHGLANLPKQALRATRERLAKEGKQGPVEKPGAYYQRIVIKLLEDRQIFVPTLAEKDESDPETVRNLARASLCLPLEEADSAKK